ncbi:Lysophospholipase L2 [Flavobacterium sp. 9R]|uniref:alpha/beta hydrolase n=1 Tax=Flavobacterium sp. 9R TaxID=2653143 RepID=UPI0012F26268|nr:alpha/beta hydrolase [Flavobacterium sp. 9R]VXB91568.1 Lysophospholipase L2 [Flavobacterium sp. 9R]
MLIIYDFTPRITIFTDNITTLESLLIYAMKTILYQSDYLGNGFEFATINQPDDYEGKVVATVIRKQCSMPSNKAVLYVHGFNDYFFQSEMAQKFNEKGFHFYAVDLRKYGRSTLHHQKINNMRSLTEYFTDLDEALAIMRQEGNEQVLLSGHSTGGLLVTLYASERVGNEKFDAIFCNSPFYDMNMPGYQKRLLVPLVALFGKYFPDVLLPGKISEWYGHSLHGEKKGEWDYNLAWKPHLVPALNAGWISAIHQGHKKIKNGVILTRPILVMHSHQSIYSNDWNASFFEGDAILNVKDIKAGAERIVAPKRTIIEIEGGMHDLILSPLQVREQVYFSLFEWLKQIIK